MKLIDNVFFSAFVFYVLILTVVTITGSSPPSPSPKSSSRPQNDDSLLKTGENLTTLALSSPHPQSSTNAASSSSCSNSDDIAASSSLNYSDPAVLSAIQRFNSKVFRKSVVFLGYDAPPVLGARSKYECDDSWRFCNRKDKSWRCNATTVVAIT